MVVLRHLDLQIMKKYIIPILLAAAAMLTVQCAKEELTDGTPAVPEETVTITLQGDVTGTKTILDPETGAVYWEEGDIVWINGNNYEVIPDPDDPSKATVTDVTKADTYLAVFSTYYQPVVNVDEENCIISISPNQYYSEERNSFGRYDNTTVAYSEDTQLSFKNLMGIIRVGITGTGGLQSTSLWSNDGAGLGGYLTVPTADIISGELGNYSDFSTISYSCITVRASDADSIGLDSSEPAYLYFVVPARTYSSGFSVIMEDEDGNVCIQSTDKSITVNRSEIVPMTTFGFTPGTVEITVAADEAGASATSVPYTITAAPGAPVVSKAVTLNLWNAYLESNPDISPDIIATYLLDMFHGDSIMSLDAAGNYSGTLTTAYNSNGYTSDLTASTGYVILAGYSNGSSTIGNACWTMATTAAAEGEGPALDVQFAQTDTPYNTIQAVITTSGAADIKCYALLSEIYDQYIASGMDDRSIVINNAVSVSEEDLAEANSSGLGWLWQNLNSGSAYKVMVMAVGEGGAETIKVLDHTTDTYLPADGQWQTVSTDGYMECGLLYAFSVGDFALSGLTIEKYGDYDIFRIKNPLDIIAESNPNLFTVTDGYLTIDARGGYVRLEQTENYVGLIYTEMFPDDQNGISYCSLPDYGFEGSYGYYDETSGIIDLGDVGMILSDYDNSIYLTGPTRIYLHNPETGAAASTKSAVNLKTPETGKLHHPGSGHGICGKIDTGFSTTGCALRSK